MPSYGYAAYKETRVNTASQSNLIIMLYDGAIKYLNKAVASLEGKEHAQAHEHLIKTQDILAELMGALNMNIEVAQNLHSLYAYCIERLVAANVAKDVEPITEVLGYLQELRQTWVDIAQPQPQEESRPQDPKEGVEIIG